jgi:phosphate transport system ATP-binding protein
MKIKIDNLNFSYNKFKVLENIDLKIDKNTITAVSGPSGSGKSTLLTCLNRLWEEYDEALINGNIKAEIEGRLIDIYNKKISVSWLRQKIGMVFQMPNPFPMSIEQNLLFPFRLKTSPFYSKKRINKEIVKALKKVHLYEEVENRTYLPADSLSGGQQQRLCIARALIPSPEILLLDEPTSSLDSNAEKRIEDLLKELKKECTIIIVSHSESQIKRVADHHIHVENGKITKDIKY